MDYIRNTFSLFKKRHGQGSYGIFYGDERLSCHNGKNTWTSELGAKRAIINHIRQSTGWLGYSYEYWTRNKPEGEPNPILVRDARNKNWIKRPYLPIEELRKNFLEVITIKELPIIEQLADVQHQIWARWMGYQFSMSKRNEDGSFTIPKELVKRWQQQMETGYYELSEKEKESDRNQARKFIGIIND